MTDVDDMKPNEGVSLNATNLGDSLARLNYAALTSHTPSEKQKLVEIEARYSSKMTEKKFNRNLKVHGPLAIALCVVVTLAYQHFFVEPLSLSVVIPVLVIVGGSIAGMILSILVSVSRAARFRGFSADNGIVYTKRIAKLSPLGSSMVALAAPTNPSVGHSLVAKDGSFFVANMEYETSLRPLKSDSDRSRRRTASSDDNYKTIEWGVAGIKLNAILPKMLLDSNQNTSIFNMTTLGSIPYGQQFRLEGNFQEFFRLYVPDGTELDALYFLTPDTMAKLIDKLSKYNIEIVDQYVLISQRGRWRFWHKRQLATILKSLVEIKNILDHSARNLNPQEQGNSGLRYQAVEDKQHNSFRVGSSVLNTLTFQPYFAWVVIGFIIGGLSLLFGYVAPNQIISNAEQNRRSNIIFAVSFTLLIIWVVGHYMKNRYRVKTDRPKKPFISDSIGRRRFSVLLLVFILFFVVICVLNAIDFYF